MLGELRELSRGIHPAILSEGGLGPALRTLARRSSVPVELQVGTQGRLPERVGWPPTTSWRPGGVLGHALVFDLPPLDKLTRSARKSSQLR